MSTFRSLAEVVGADPWTDLALLRAPVASTADLMCELSHGAIGRPLPISIARRSRRRELTVLPTELRDAA